MTLNKGEVPVVLAGTDYVLKPTLQAFSSIATKFKNQHTALQELGSGNVDAILYVLSQGLGYSKSMAEKLPGLVMKTGVPALIEPCSDFVFRLYNGGKSVEEVLTELRAKSPDGEAEPAGETAAAEASPFG